MFTLMQHLEALQLSMVTLSIGTGMMIGTFIGQTLPLPEPDAWRG